jgi:hypothetical protein
MVVHMQDGRTKVVTQEVANGILKAMKEGFKYFYLQQGEDLVFLIFIDHILFIE